MTVKVWPILQDPSGGLGTALELHTFQSTPRKGDFVKLQQRIGDSSHAGLIAEVMDIEHEGVLQDAIELPIITIWVDVKK